jgi:hypothetical protein
MNILFEHPTTAYYGIVRKKLLALSLLNNIYRALCFMGLFAFSTISDHGQNIPRPILFIVNLIDAMLLHGLLFAMTVTMINNGAEQ